VSDTIQRYSAVISPPAKSLGGYWVTHADHLAALATKDAEIAALRTELTKALRDAERYRSFRQLVKDDHVLAQFMVWNAHPSRKKFDKFVDFERGEKK
jgi:hypothetical protein